MAVEQRAEVRTPASKNGHMRKGWLSLRFDEIATNVATRVDPGSTKEEVYVGLEHLDSESLRISRWGTPSDVKGQKLEFQTGDIIFGKRRAYQRKLGVAETSGICSAHAMVLRTESDLIHPDFLAFFMQSDLFMDRAESISVGSLSPTINWRTLRAERFPIPPRREQDQIVELLQAADDALEAFKLSARHAERMRRVMLFRMLSGTEWEGTKKKTKLGAIPKSWDVQRIGDAGEVQLGRQRAPRYQTGQFTKPYLRVANVFDGYFDLSDVLEMDFNERDFTTYSLRKNDILLNEGQSRELVGRCAIYNDEVEACCFQNTLVRFRCGDELIPRFAFYYFQFAFYKGVFAAIASQTTSIAHLGAERFARLHMPIPPASDQEKIVNVCDNALAARDQLRDHVDRLLEVKQRLRDSMVQNGLAGTGSGLGGGA